LPDVRFFPLSSICFIALLPGKSMRSIDQGVPPVAHLHK